MIKLKRMTLTGHVARMREIMKAYKMLIENPEGKKYSEDVGVDGKVNVRMDLREVV
jgi:hypothetical protein